MNLHTLNVGLAILLAVTIGIDYAGGADPNPGAVLLLCLANIMNALNRRR